MKIAFMVYDKPDYFGGPITNARRLLPELKKRGHDVHAMIFFHEDSPAARYLSSKGVICHVKEYPRFTELQIFWILRTLRKIQPDIFVPNIFVSGWYAAKWVQQAGIPSIAAHRSDDNYHWGMVEEFVSGSSEWAIDGLVCVSHAIHKEVERQVAHHTQLCMIPSGVPLPERISPQTYPLKIIYAGRLVQPQKRIWETLKALIHVVQMIPEVRVTLIGEGEERSALEQHIQKLNLSSKIKFLGAIPNEQLHQEMLNHHVIVLLSDYEGTPGSIMDGMACGLIPVCINITGGITELVIHEKTGLLVQNRMDSFLEAIQRLSNDYCLRKNLSRSAREHIEKEYSLTVATDRWESFFYNLQATSSTPKKISIPQKTNLPQINPKLVHQDVRLPKVRLKRLIVLSKIFLKQKLEKLARAF